MSTAQSELADPPQDGISAIQFAPSHNLLLVSSWNTEVRMYDVLLNAKRAQYNHQAAALDCCWGTDQNRCFSGGVDKCVKTYDFTSETEAVLGNHDKAVKAVCWQKELGCCVSGSWDKQLKVWDLRQTACVNSALLPDKVFTMAVSSNRIVVGTASRHVWIYDVRNLSEPEQKRESSLKFQTRCIRCYPDGTGYALSSIEGRVAMEYFDPDTASQAKKYAFKCHRSQDEKGIDTVYPVNALAFHPSYGTFATGGCDGKVIMWDGQNKKRLQAPWSYPTSIASLAFNPTGAMLAVASSYTFEEGEKDAPPDQIFFRSVNESDVRPRAKQAQ
uniref:Mitotic checkpoint protein BUB3 n=1 Tax=Hanusia phi TaxID=3032 RepID=A0A7S0F0I8_9CRYP|mmetsp:Transcript_34407/g.77585  ORF Transcript_34407/g.77585 Transcript_34407/m.77585 type:complete len:330 (+) Transcript_34407:45-1034(+)